VDPIPAYIPCHPKDLVTLPFCVESLARHPQVGTIHVIAPREVAPECRRLGVEYLYEGDLLDTWFPEDTPYGDTRWFYQQALKMSVAFMDDAPDRYLIFDADTVLLHPFPLVDEDSGVVAHPRLDDDTPAYFAGIRDLFGHDVTYDGSYIAHFMVFRSRIVREMFDEFARVKGRPAAEGRDVLRELLTRADRDSVSFSDYETYGHFVDTHVPGELEWAERRQINMMYVEPSDRVLARLRPHYDYVSFHAYRQSTNGFKRLAGRAWFELRIARDRLGSRRPLSASAASASAPARSA
jgi:hypothetical protein